MDQEARDHHLLETIKSVVQRTLAHIELQQTSAVEKPVDPGIVHAFSHLLMLDDTSATARLKVYYRKKGRHGENRPPRVALLLEMDRLGTVRSDLWMVGKDLKITFFVQTEEAKAVIDSEGPQIRSALRESFNTVAVKVVVNEKKIEQFDEEDLVAAPRRQVDLSI